MDTCAWSPECGEAALLWGCRLRRSSSGQSSQQFYPLGHLSRLLLLTSFYLFLLDSECSIKSNSLLITGIGLLKHELLTCLPSYAPGKGNSSTVKPPIPRTKTSLRVPVQVSYPPLGPDMRVKGPTPG